MPFKVKKRGKLTYYYGGDEPVLSSLVVETLPDGDLRICFAGLTGGYSAASVLGLETVTFMDPEIEIPLVFQCWEKWLRDAEICNSIADVDFIEIHAFGCQPKTPNPLVDPEGYIKEQERLRTAYRKAYGNYFREHCPDNGLPARFTVHVVDVPDRAASYEFYGVALYQQALQKTAEQQADVVDTNPMEALLDATLQEQMQAGSLKSQQ
ncbi:MAG: hypothetical protein NT075_11790 [Chloroflexi bacterium]|nr:hypothetical protein [Chloroflexota bacterium]